ncbi:hypothetical protein, partial [Serratia marcescens]
CQMCPTFGVQFSAAPLSFLLPAHHASSPRRFPLFARRHSKKANAIAFLILFPIAFLAGSTINLTILIEVIPNEFQVVARRQGRASPGAYSGK